MSKEFDLLLCGVTGFTGKLAAEHLLVKGYPIKWAVCARNLPKAESVLAEIGERVGKASQLPRVEVADLVCASEEDEEKLRAVIRKTKVVITTAGPFEKYGQSLVKVCAEEGVHCARHSVSNPNGRAIALPIRSCCRLVRTAAHCGGRP